MSESAYYYTLDTRKKVELCCYNSPHKVRISGHCYQQYAGHALHPQIMSGTDVTTIIADHLAECTPVRAVPIEWKKAACRCPLSGTTYIGKATAIYLVWTTQQNRLSIDRYIATRNIIIAHQHQRQQCPSIQLRVATRNVHINKRGCAPTIDY